MKELVVQLQLWLANGIDCGGLRRELEEWGAKSAAVERVSSTMDEPKGFINVTFVTKSSAELWRELEAKFRRTDAPGLADVSVVVCQGPSGWDDFLVLHHFSPEQKVDTV